MNTKTNDWLIENGVLKRYLGSNYDEIVIPDEVEVVHTTAFADIPINHLVIPKNVKKIALGMYMQIKKLTIYSKSYNIYINASVNELEIYNYEDDITKKIIGEMLNNVNIEKITILGKELNYNNLKDIFYRLSEKKIKLTHGKYKDFLIGDNILIGYTGSDTEVVIPDGVTRIDFNAFFNKKIEKVSLPKSLISIYENAFYNCNLTELYLPDSLETINVAAFHGNNITKVSLNNKLETHDYFLENAEEIEIRADRLSDVKDSWLKRDKKIIIRVNKEISQDELEAFYATNLYYITTDGIDIIVRDKNKEKSKYTLTINGLRKVTIGSNLQDFDLKVIQNLNRLYIDNSDGKAITNFIELLESNNDFKFCNLEDIYIIGVPITKLEKRRLNKFLKFWHFYLEASNDYALKTFNDRDLVKSNIYSEEVASLLAKINEIAKDLSSSNQDVIKSKVKEILNKYEEDLDNAKPKLTFHEPQVFGESVITFKDLNFELIVKLNVIINIINIANHYKNLKKELEQYEEYLKSDKSLEVGEVKTTSDKVKFIINISKKYNLELFLQDLKITIMAIKEEISAYFYRRLEGNFLEEEINLNVKLETKIDELYERVLYFIVIEELFNDPSKSLLASFILHIKNKINNLAINYQKPYQERLDKIVTKNYWDLVNTNSENLGERVIDIKKELDSLLQEIESIESIYGNNANIINSLDNITGESINHAPAITGLINEINNFISSEELNDFDKESIKCELNSVLTKWKNIIIAGTITFAEKDILPNMIPKILISSENIKIQILILKDLLALKNTVTSYIDSSREYKNFKQQKIVR